MTDNFDSEISTSFIFEKPVDGALYMFEQGHPVFPVNENQKTPAVKGWQDWARKASRQKIEDFGRAQPMYNWGVLCDSLIVIDVDDRGKKKGSDSLSLWEKQYGKIVDTLSVRTPSGGRHIYFRGEGRNTTHSLAPGIDTRARNGYVVAPGSRIDNRAYEIETNGGIAGAPMWLLQLLAQKAVKEETQTKAIQSVDAAAHVREAIDYLKRAPICVEGSGENGGEYLLKVIFQVRDLGISKDMARELVLEHYSERCEPPWDMDDYEDHNHFEAKLRNAYSYAQNETIGAGTAEAQFKEEINDKDWPLDLSYFEIGEAPKRKWVVKDWLPLNEISSLYGSGSTGKSLLSLQLGLAIAGGGKFIDFKIRKPMRFIGIYCEDSKDELHRRLDSIRNAPEFAFLEPMKENFLLWPRVGKDSALVNVEKETMKPGPFMKKLQKYLETLPLKENKFLVLDTLSDVYNGNENIREMANRCIKLHIGSMAIKFKCTVLLLAHPSQRGVNQKDFSSGSTAWENAVRNRMALFNNENREGAVVLKRIKSNYAKSGEELVLEWEHGRFIKCELDSQEEKAEAQDLARFLSDRLPKGSKIKFSDLITDMATEPGYTHLFKGVDSQSRRREKIMAILKRAALEVKKQSTYI